MSSDLWLSNITFLYSDQDSRVEKVRLDSDFSHELNQNNFTDVLSIQLTFGPLSPEIKPDNSLNHPPEKHSLSLFKWANAD